MLEEKIRYLQIAFNGTAASALKVMPSLPVSSRILIEAGTPFIKREGMAGLRNLRSVWKGYLIADMKVSDGAMGEVEMARNAGANGITILGSSPVETLNLFIRHCSALGMDGMIDMIGVSDPLAVLRPLLDPPAVVILHRGRDEESTRGKVIQYRHVNRIHSKYPVLISAAGGVDLKEASSAIFNGASIVVVNMVEPGDPWLGIRTDQNVGIVAREFLSKIE